MKKFIALILALVMAFSLAACGKSDAAKAVDEQIAALGEITADSGDAIEAAEQALEDLADEDREQLDNTDALKTARTTYDPLVVEAAIADIGTVTLESAGAISSARNLFNKSTTEVQAAVSNAADLEAAEDKLEALRVEQVSGMIDAIGEVSEESGDAIEAAQTAYDALSGKGQAKVTNAQVLTDAQSTYRSLMMQKAEKLLSGFTVEDDPVDKVKFYIPKARPAYVNTRSYALPYIGVNENNQVWLVSQFDYTGSDWVFFEKIIFSIDGVNTEKSYNVYKDIVRDNAYGTVWEYVMVVDEDGQYKDLFWAIANSTETIIRFDGDHYWEDFTVSQSDKDAIRDTLTAYDAMLAAGYTDIYGTSK